MCQKLREWFRKKDFGPTHTLGPEPLELPVSVFQAIVWVLVKYDINSIDRLQSHQHAWTENFVIKLLEIFDTIEPGAYGEFSFINHQNRI